MIFQLLKAMPYLADTMLKPTETSKKVKFLKKKTKNNSTNYSSRRVRRSGEGGRGGGVEEGW